MKTYELKKIRKGKTLIFSVNDGDMFLKVGGCQFLVKCPFDEIKNISFNEKSISDLVNNHKLVPCIKVIDEINGMSHINKEDMNKIISYKVLLKK